jgi:hypothetical protein
MTTKLSHFHCASSFLAASFGSTTYLAGVIVVLSRRELTHQGQGYNTACLNGTF